MQRSNQPGVGDDARKDEVKQTGGQIKKPLLTQKLSNFPGAWSSGPKLKQE
jgi:hypothetical protein